MGQAAWVTDANAALLTDLYQLSMLQSYLEHGLREEAAFDLFVRRLPGERNYLLACGLDDVLRYLEHLAFSPEALDYLASLGRFSREFLDYLADFRFSGDIYAVPEGTPVFAGEPILEVVAPLPEAQLVETYLLNQVHIATLAASKAARVVTAAAGRRVADFGLRHAHGTDAGLKAARAAYIAGVAATSNVLAGQIYDVPLAGTMAHSYIEAHDDEAEAFRHFAASHPDTILLVDTYDTLQGVRRLIALASVLGPDFRVRGVRLDSGDLATLARQARALLDAAGLQQVHIFASGSLDETAIRDLVQGGAPIDGFGVGTLMSVSADAPYLDTAYKLVAYAGRGRMKLSPEKPSLPGRKQVYRIVQDGVARRDVLALHDDPQGGEPLLQRVMQGGKRLPAASPPLEDIRRHVQQALQQLPERVRALEPADPPYPVELSAGLAAERDRLRAALESETGRQLRQG